MNWKILALAMVFSIAVLGCATPSELRTRAPSLELKSNFDAKRVAACIADKWENALPLLGTQPVNLKITSTGYSVAHGVEETIHLVDISDSPTGGSNTTYYKNRSSLIERFDPGVVDCQTQ